MKHLSLLTLVLLTGLSAAIAQQGRISGKITDTEQEAINWATVYIDELKKETATQLDGSFSFDNIPYGTYQLIVIGAQSKDVKKRIQHHQAQTVHNFQIDIASEELESVTVFEKSEKAKIETQGYAANVIKTDRAALQSIQTNELLDRTAGVRIRQSGGLGSNIEYNINGLSGNAIRILIDGVPIRNYGPSFSLNSIPPSLIDRIEIYKGVIPPHLADDALGGAINIVLKKSMRNNINAAYSFGSFGTHQANLTAFNRNEKTGFTVNGSAFYNYTKNNYKVWGDKVYMTDPNNGRILRGNEYERFHDAYRSAGGKLDIGFTKVKWADEFYVGGLVSDMRNEIQHGATMEIVYGNRFATQATQLANLVYKKKDLFLKGLDVNVMANYSYLLRNVVDTVADMYNWDGSTLGRWATGGEQGRATLQTSDEYNFSVRANVRYAINKNNFIGINQLYNDFVRKMDDPYLPKAERDFLKDRTLQKSFTGFHFENNAFNNKLKSTLFYKYYQQDISTTSTTRSGPGGGNGTTFADIAHKQSKSGYGIALSYSVRPTIVIMSSAERAIRFPENTEVFGNNAENIIANPTLKPEQSINGNLGAYLGPFHIFDRKHQIGVNTNVFVRNTKDMIRQGVPSAVSETFSFENLNNVVSKGFDIELNYNYARKLFINANTSLFDSRFNTRFDQDGNPFFYYGSRIRNAPFFTANANVRYDWRHLFQKGSNFAIIYHWSYVHKFLRDWEGIGGANLDHVPTQLVHDLGMTYTLPNRKVTLGFDVKNIADRQVFDNWALQKPGRSFFGKISYTIF